MPRFLLLFAAALIFLVATPLLGVGPGGVIGGKLILTALLLIAVAELRHRAFGLGVILAVAAIATEWLDGIADPAGILSTAIRAVFFAYVAGVVLYNVLRQRTVTLDTLAGAACAYLFIGFMWAMLFMLLDRFEPGSIQFPEAWTQVPAGSEAARYVYFSFVTLTTVGYGDIVAKTVDASGLVVAEAVIGQLYLTILIARLVGLHLSERGTA